MRGKPVGVQSPLVPSSPLHLTASTVLQSNSPGGVNSISLKNPLSTPMEIMEIKFSIQGPIPSTNVPVILGGTVACKLDMGQIPLTNGFVPMWSFGRSTSLSFEEVGDNNTLMATSEFSWQLPRPLYVPAGAVVTPTFQHLGLIQGSVTARISYSARSLPAGTPPSGRLAVPFAASYMSKSFDMNVAGATNSVETDLTNPFAEPLYLQRFTGRVAVLINSIQSATETTVPSAAGQCFNIRMVDSVGRPIVRSFAPFSQVFSAVTRSWELDEKTFLDPRSYYQVFIRKDVPLQGSAPSSILTAQAFVGMTGWRYVAGGGK